MNNDLSPDQQYDKHRQHQQVDIGLKPDLSGATPYTPQSSTIQNSLMQQVYEPFG